MASASAPLGVPPPPNARRQHKARCGQRDRQAAADGEGSDLEQICPTVEGAACNGAHPHMASPPKEVAPSLRNEDPMSFQTGTASCSSMLATWIFLTGFGSTSRAAQSSCGSTKQSISLSGARQRPHPPSEACPFGWRLLSSCFPDINLPPT